MSISPTSSSTSCSIRPCSPKIATMKKGSPVVTNAKLVAGSREAAGRVHDARPVEQGSAGDRPQAARRTDRRMAQVVHRERHQLTSDASAAGPRCDGGPGRCVLRWIRRRSLERARHDRTGRGTPAVPEAVHGAGRDHGCDFRRLDAGDPAIQRPRAYPGLARCRRLHARQFRRDAAPALRQGVSRHRLAVPADRSDQPDPRLSAGLCAGALDATCSSSPSS